MHTVPIRPLNPILHARYVPVLLPTRDDPLPAEVRAQVVDLMRRRNTAPEADLDAIDRALVARTWWYALRPDEIADDILSRHGYSPRDPLTVDQATWVLAACGEAGYPIHGNGAPEYADYDVDPPVRGEERDRVIWTAARYWAQAASRHITYVSLGDCRGFLPRAVQYDQPGSLHPQQQAALTLGPWADRGDECDSHGYMRGHTRRLLLVRSAEAPPGRTSTTASRTRSTAARSSPGGSGTPLSVWEPGR